MYKQAVAFLSKFLSADKVFKYGFNLSPMYRRSVGKVAKLSEDLHHATVRIPLNYKNKNYMGAMFGGSMFSATDPIYMIQLIQILGNDYVVWDKAATIRYRRPAYETVIAHFIFSKEEIDDIKHQVTISGELDIIKHLNLTDHTGKVIFAELEKTMYVASKEHYKKKLEERQARNKT